MSAELTPDERAMAEEHHAEIEATLLSDVDELYERADKVACIGEQARDNLEFIEDSEAPVDDVRLALEMLDELDDAMVYLKRQKRQMEGLLNEMSLIEEDL